MTLNCTKCREESRHTARLEACATAGAGWNKMVGMTTWLKRHFRAFKLSTREASER